MIYLNYPAKRARSIVFPAISLAFSGKSRNFHLIVACSLGLIPTTLHLGHFVVTFSQIDRTSHLHRLFLHVVICVHERKKKDAKREQKAKRSSGMRKCVPSRDTDLDKARDAIWNSIGIRPLSAIDLVPSSLFRSLSILQFFSCQLSKRETRKPRLTEWIFVTRSILLKYRVYCEVKRDLLPLGDNWRYKWVKVISISR